MSAQTSRYGIKYPTGGDLVSSIPQHMQQAAESIETALANVDDRHTNTAYAPVIRTTKYQLDQATRQPGQLGIVNADPKTRYNGNYIADSSKEWHKIATTTLQTTMWKPPYTDNVIMLTRVSNLIIVTGGVKFTSGGQANYLKVNERMPLGYRPYEDGANIAFFGNAQFALQVNRDGTVIALGDRASQYMRCLGIWVTNDDYPA